MVMGLVPRVVFSQSFWVRVLPGGTCLIQPRWMPERRILGGSWTCGVSFWPFLNSSGWWWLISSVFLTRTFCHKTTHANGYYGTWPGWAVSVNVLSLTVRLTQLHTCSSRVSISTCLLLKAVVDIMSKRPNPMGDFQNSASITHSQYSTGSKWATWPTWVRMGGHRTQS